MRKEKYRCYFGDKCIIDSHNRNRCKSCRFQKCLKEGMSVEGTYLDTLIDSFRECRISIQGVRMGRIPKLVKEKALAEYNSSSMENEDPGQTNPPHISPLRLNSTQFLSTSTLTDIQLPIIDEHFLFADLDSVPIDNQLNCHTPLLLPSTNAPPNSSMYHTYQLPNNFTIDETKPEHIEEDNRIVQLNPTALSNYMTNCDERFAGNVIERMKAIVEKISHPTMANELDYEQSSFTRHLRWKMFDLANTYNGRTRQLVERMNSMIRLSINDFPGNSSSLQDIWAGLTGFISMNFRSFPLKFSF